MEFKENTPSKESTFDITGLTAYEVQIIRNALWNDHSASALELHTQIPSPWKD